MLEDGRLALFSWVERKWDGGNVAGGWKYRAEEKS